MSFRRVSTGLAVVTVTYIVTSCALPDAPIPPADAGPGGSSSGGSDNGGTSQGGSATGGASGSATGGAGGTTSGGSSGASGTASGGSSGASGGTTSTGGAGSSSGGASSGQGGGGTAGSMGGAGAGGKASGGAGAGGAGASGAGSGGKASGGAGAGGAGAGGSSAGGAGSGGTAGGGAIVELAQGRTATADSEENNTTSNPPKVNLAPSGNDGSATTRWCAASGGAHYWQVDLGASHTLSRIEIDFEYPSQAADSAYGYVVGVSTDGTSFTTAIDQSANTSTTMTQTAPFPAATSGRYVRITVTPPTTTPSATWASFWEARVFGQ